MKRIREKVFMRRFNATVVLHCFPSYAFITACRLSSKVNFKWWEERAAKDAQKEMEHRELMQGETEAIATALADALNARMAPGRKPFSADSIKVKR